MAGGVFGKNGYCVAGIAAPGFEPEMQCNKAFILAFNQTMGNTRDQLLQGCAPKLQSKVKRI